MQVLWLFVLIRNANESACLMGLQSSFICTLLECVVVVFLYLYILFHSPPRMRWSRLKYCIWLPPLPQEKVLHNIMPIFTFMGANIMRLDDSYSFQVINKTVQAVIPALIKVSADWNHGEC